MSSPGHVGRQGGFAERSHRDFKVARQNEVNFWSHIVFNVDELRAVGHIVEQVGGRPSPLQRVACTGCLVHQFFSEVGHNGASFVGAVVGGRQQRRGRDLLATSDDGVGRTIVKQWSGLIEAADLLRHIDGSTAVVKYRVDVGHTWLLWVWCDNFKREVHNQVTHGAADFDTVDDSFPAKPTTETEVTVVVVGAKADLESEITVAGGVVQLQVAAFKIASTVQEALVALEHVHVPFVERKVIAGVDVLESFVHGGPFGTTQTVVEHIKHLEPLIVVELVNHMAGERSHSVSELRELKAVLGFHEVVRSRKPLVGQAINADRRIGAHAECRSGLARQVWLGVWRRNAGHLGVLFTRAVVQCRGRVFASDAF